LRESALHQETYAQVDSSAGSGRRGLLRMHLARSFSLVILALRGDIPALSNAAISIELGRRS